jgi:hypothetical protein
MPAWGNFLKLRQKRTFSIHPANGIEKVFFGEECCLYLVKRLQDICQNIIPVFQSN